MIKQLLLTAALLAPGLASGQVSAPLPVDPTVVPAPPGQGLEGDPAQDPPAPAAAAGFTNHIIAADFTSPAYSNTASFIVNCGASASVSGQPSTWHYYLNLGSSSATPGSGYPGSLCGNITMVSDPPYSQVMRLTYPVSQFSSSNNQITMTFPGEYAGSYAGGQWLPTELYEKIVLRAPASSWAQSTPDGSQRTVPPGGDTGGQWLFEITSEPYNGKAHATINSWPGNYQAVDPAGVVYNWPGGDYTGYQTIEALYTSDESTNLWECVWLNANPTYTTGFQGCMPTYTTGFSVPNLTKAKNMIEFLVALSNNGTDGDTQAFIKSWDVYVCPGSPASTCPGTMITTWPPP
jgi:hypothetical protein